MSFNEDTRVKIPSILHLTRLGYKYLSLKGVNRDEQTNIFSDIFRESITKINDDLSTEESKRLQKEISLLLDNNDLGKAFFEKLIDQSGIKLIDFENFDRNTFHVVTELTYKNGDESFRPDIILLINGMPLVFIEVKKPNNKEGVLAERNRINTRFKNKKFKKFVNITQLMIFSNNMEYSANDPAPIQGAFYASPSYSKPIFNYFREEEKFDLATLLKPLDGEIENFVLRDNNLVSIKNNAAFITNKEPDRPTNRIITSLLSKDRLAFVLQYALTYVKESHGLEKHIMRYPQLFATKAIEQTLNKGIKKGIIWHTQGSGKTALAYYNVKYLTNYFRKQRIIPKFYFIVDRIDLAVQAGREFTSRGLTVNKVNSKTEFVKSIKKTTTLNNFSGKPEITVVNIHKFSEDTKVVKSADYDVNIQHIYFLDEVHRSYNPKGSFLANLSQSDRNAIKIGLTGTPLLAKKRKKPTPTSSILDKSFDSKQIFGDYIHKYYYNASIADGYTLRLIREEIETKYRMILETALKEIKILKGDVSKAKIFAHPKFVEPMLEYVVTDFESFRQQSSDASIGAMVVCDSSDQAKELFKIFQEQYLSKGEETTKSVKKLSYVEKQKLKNQVTSAALILHDVGTKQERKQQIEEFKDGKIDFLFVYNMLLTGFDAKRLKKLYLARVIKRHNLLQALTRVNRKYGDFKFGRVVDFADISKEFDATNKLYFDELQSELGDEMEHYSNLFKSAEEIKEEIENIKEIIFHYDIVNTENFTTEISLIDDREKMLALVKALENAKSLFNLMRFYDQEELAKKLSIENLPILYREASNRLQLLNQRNAIKNNVETTNLLNVALEDIIFNFRKLGEEELVLAHELKDTLRKAREEMANNFDPKDPAFTTLYEELERLFKQKKIQEVSQDGMKDNIGALRKIYKAIKELNRKNDLLRKKYEGDKKYARIHKRLREKGNICSRETQLHGILKEVQSAADMKVIQNEQIIENESYFEKEMMRLIIQKFRKENNIKTDVSTTEYINQLVVKEYIYESQGKTAW